MGWDPWCFGVGCATGQHREEEAEAPSWHQCWVLSQSLRKCSEFPKEDPTSAAPCGHWVLLAVPEQERPGRELDQAEEVISIIYISLFIISIISISHLHLHLPFAHSVPLALWQPLALCSSFSVCAEGAG